ncbi:hypothetical protein GCM10027612_50480 [Microbispora bryophytorum subsp. camponoti]
MSEKAAGDTDGTGGRAPEAVRPEKARPQEARLQEAAAACPGTLAVCVPGVLGLNEDVVLPLASTGKVLLLAALAQDVAAGVVDPDERVTLRDEDYAGGSGLLTGLSARDWTAGDLALLTAAVSDNTATNALLRRSGSAGWTRPPPRSGWPRPGSTTRSASPGSRSIRRPSPRERRASWRA